MSARGAHRTQPFAATLGCKVIVVLTGWTKDDVDEEHKDKGRGSRGALKLPGSNHALPGVSSWFQRARLHSGF